MQPDFLHLASSLPTYSAMQLDFALLHLASSLPHISCSSISLLFHLADLDFKYIKTVLKRMQAFFFVFLFLCAWLNCYTHTQPHSVWVDRFFYNVIIVILQTFYVKIYFMEAYNNEAQLCKENCRRMFCISYDIICSHNQCLLMT